MKKLLILSFLAIVYSCKPSKSENITIEKEYVVTYERGGSEIIKAYYYKYEDFDHIFIGKDGSMIQRINGATVKSIKML